MHEERAEQDGTTLLLAIIASNPGAGVGQPFSLTDNVVQQAQLSPARRDAAMWWLIDNDVLERDEETEHRLRNVKGLPEYEYGIAFRVTEYGRRMLNEVGA